MLLQEIVETSRRVTQVRARLNKIEHLSACIRRLPPEEVEVGVNYLIGRLRQGNIGIGPAALHQARPARAAGQPLLTVLDVDHCFDVIKEATGSGSGAARRRILHELFSQATPAEQDFLIRLALGELRQGALEGVMVDAVAKAAALPAADVRRALMLAGDLALVSRAALVEGATGLRQFSLQVLKPIHPMLAQPADDVAEALEHFPLAGFEYKMDGARIQLHKDGEEVRVFTRSLNDVTASVPEIVEAGKRVGARSVVLDGEALAFRSDGVPHPFQVTMRRFGRKLEVDQLRQTLPLAPFFFDCLHVEGDDLIDRPSSERVDVLRTIVPAEARTPRLVTSDRKQAEGFLQEALSRGHEGVMAKSLNAIYEAGRRGSSWLKIKRAHTLDLVVLAAEWGHGRRQGWLSNLHLGARNAADGSFVMLGKTFKGMTDAMLQWQTETLLALEIGRDGIVVHVRPQLVVEIAFNDLQVSPHYPGGLALRFARVKRYRPDKAAEDADTIEMVRALYFRQAVEPDPGSSAV